MMTYRGIRDKSNSKKALADWMFTDHDFPKHTSDYNEISQYLEFNPPFTEALTVFDDVWEDYVQNN